MEIEFFVHPKKLEDCPEIESLKDLEVNALTAKAQAGNNAIIRTTIGDLLKAKTLKSKWHAYWMAKHYDWFLHLGVKPDKLRLRQHVHDELSHYATDTWDIEYNYEFGWKELEGIADRTDFDLKQHAKHSKTDLVYFDETTKEKVVPYVAAEPSLGVDRAFLTFIIDAYHEEEVKGEKRIVLKINPKLAAYKVAVFPLVNKDELPQVSQDVYNKLKPHFYAFYDDSGSIGRRYRRMDEIGTPFCITIDYDTIKDQTVTLRYRDSMKQERVAISQLIEKLNKQLNV